MRAWKVRKQWWVVVASLTATIVLPFVGGGVAYGLPTDAGPLSAPRQLGDRAPRVDSGQGMSGGYRAKGLRARATTTATFLVPELDATDCGPTDEAWASRFVYRNTQDAGKYVQIWTHCTSGRLTAGGWWYEDGRFLGRLPGLSPGERLTVSTAGSRHETRLSVHNLDRGWVAENASPIAPSGDLAIWAENVWDGDLPVLERASFKRLRIDGRAFGEYGPKRSKLDCTRVSPLREGTSFRVTYECTP